MAPFLARQLSMKRDTEDRLHLRRLIGDDSAGTILYVHGLGESALCFERVMADPRLAAWDHLAADLEGYGKSAWAPEPLSLEEHAGRLTELVGRLRLGSVVVVGHSMGGVIGTYLSRRLGRSLRAFVDVEGNISRDDCGFSSRADAYSADEWLASGFDRVVDAIRRLTSETSGVRSAYIASILMCDPRAYHRNSQELVEVSRSETLVAHLAALEAPVVYVHGAPRGTSKRSLGLLKAASVERIRIGDAGHWPFLDRHDAFVDAFAGFLQQLPAAEPE